MWLHAYQQSGSPSMLPSVIGLSASVKALALYWMQSMVRGSEPVFFAVDLIGAVAAQDDVELLVGLVGVQEATVLTRHKRLE